MPKKPLAKCHVFFAGSSNNSSWTAGNIFKWMTRQGGTLQHKLTAETTHSSGKAWRCKAAVVSEVSTAQHGVRGLGL